MYKDTCVKTASWRAPSPGMQACGEDTGRLTFTGSAQKLARSIMGEWKKLLDTNTISTHIPVLIPADGSLE